MRKVIAIAVFVLAFAFTAFAQGQSSNEGFVGYSASRTNLESPSDLTSGITHGVVGTFTHYWGDDKAKGKVGTFGVVVDLNVQFTREGITNVTVAEGFKLAARNSKKVQPYVQALVGVSQNKFGNRLDFDQSGGVSIKQRGDVTLALIGGAGVDIPLKEGSRTKVRVGANYRNTQHDIPGKRYQHNVDAFVGIVF
jgi:hypothetical protein